MQRAGVFEPSLMMQPQAQAERARVMLEVKLTQPVFMPLTFTFDNLNI